MRWAGLCSAGCRARPAGDVRRRHGRCLHMGCRLCAHLPAPAPPKPPPACLSDLHLHTPPPTATPSAGRKSCAITCATRLSQFLGDDRIKDKVGRGAAARGTACIAADGLPGHCIRGWREEFRMLRRRMVGEISCVSGRHWLATDGMLHGTPFVSPLPPQPHPRQGLVCNYVIARNPPNQPTSERAIPVAIFRWERLAAWDGMQLACVVGLRSGVAVRRCYAVPAEPPAGCRVRQADASCPCYACSAIHSAPSHLWRAPTCASGAVTSARVSPAVGRSVRAAVLFP